MLWLPLKIRNYYHTEIGSHWLLHLSRGRLRELLRECFDDIYNNKFKKRNERMVSLSLCLANFYSMPAFLIMQHTVCQISPESNQHIFVSCSRKWSFWQTVFEELKLCNDYPNPDSVWTALSTIHNSTSQPIEEDTLLSFRIIFETL